MDFPVVGHVFNPFLVNIAGYIELGEYPVALTSRLDHNAFI